MPTDKVIKVLLIEDVRTDAELAIREMRRAGLTIDYHVVDTEEQFHSIVKQFSPDVILSDFSMPLYDGMAALADARESCPLVPFIFVSGTLGEEYAIRALQEGAADYVLKTNLIRLPTAVTRALKEARDLASRLAVETELRATRERLNNIFESLDDAVWSWSVDQQKLTYVAPAATAIYGRSPEEFLRRPELWHDTIHPEDRNLVKRAWQQLLANTGVLDIEYRIVRQNGEVRWVSNRARLLFGETGAPERIDGIVRDVSERMEQQRRIARLTRVRELSSAVSSAIVRLRDRQYLVEEVCRIAVRVGGFRTAGVILRG